MTNQQALEATSPARQGVLAIWADCKPGHEALFEQWYQHEHLPERLAVPGFNRGRRYEALDSAPRYLTCYHADDTAVFRSPAYLERLDDPTPLTRKVMTQAVANLSRTICHCEVGGGFATGAFALTVPLTGTVAERTSSANTAKEQLANLLLTHHGLTHFEIWQADEDSMNDDSGAVSAEQALRGRDETISGCVFVETLREADAHEIKQTLNASLAHSSTAGSVYRLLCDARSG